MKKPQKTQDTTQLRPGGAFHETERRFCPGCGLEIQPSRVECSGSAPFDLTCPGCGCVLPEGILDDLPSDDFELQPPDATTLAGAFPDQPQLVGTVLTTFPVSSSGGRSTLEIAQTEDGDILLRITSQAGPTPYSRVSTAVEGSSTLVRLHRAP